MSPDARYLPKQSPIRQVNLHPSNTMRNSEFTLKNLFNRLIESNPTQPNKSKHRKRGRSCRIEELEGREMLSISPWTVANDQFDYGDTVIVDTSIHESVPPKSDSGIAPLADAPAANALKPKVKVDKQAATISTVTASWTDHKNATPSSNAGYEVSYSIKEGKNWTVVESSKFRTSEKTHTFIGLKPGTSYRITVTALNADGEPGTNKKGKVTSLVNATAKTEKYAAVKKLTATVNITTEQVDLKWNAHPNTDATKGYEIWMLTKVKKDVKEVLVDTIYGIGTSSASVSISTLKANVASGFNTAKNWKPTLQVRAIGEGADGTVVQSLFAKKAVTIKKNVTSDKLAAPTEFKATATESGITLAWNAVAGATGYDIRYREANESETVETWAIPKVISNGETVSELLTGFIADKTYRFEILAVKDTEKSSWIGVYAKAVNGTVSIPAPTDVSVIQTAGRAVRITWTGEAGLKYDLEIGGLTFTDVEPTTTGGTTYLVNVPLSPDATPYAYTITAYVGKDTQTATGTATVKTMTAPRDLDVRQDSGEVVTLTWSVDPNAAKYMVERSTTGTSGWTVLGEATGSYTDSTVSADNTYYYRVTAYIADAVTAWHEVSNTTSVTVVDEDEGIKNVKVVQKPGELAAEITWDAVAGAFFYHVSIWDGTTEYTWMVFEHSLDTSEEESDYDGWFVPTPGVKYEILITAFDMSADIAETEVLFTFEAVRTEPTGTKHVVDFEFLAVNDYLGLDNSCPNNLALNGEPAFIYPEFLANELGLVEADQYGTGIWQYFVENVGFTNKMSYDDYYDYYAWYGFGLSTETNTTYNNTVGWANEMSSITGSGANSSQGYGIAFWACSELDYSTWEFVSSLVMQLPDGALIDSMMVTNTVYSHGSMTIGDSFTQGPMGEGDFHTLVVVGLDADGNVLDGLGEVQFDMGRDDYIVSDWQFLDLSQLAGASQLQFSFVASESKTSWGDPVFPVYFAFDDIVYYL